jgi:DnaK suppressor protein
MNLAPPTERKDQMMSNQLSKEKLGYFKDKLLQMRKETEQEIESNPNQGPNESIQELANYDNHPADMGTEQFEQQRDAGLNLMRDDHLKEIDDALERIENGTFGLSEKSGKPIPEERLEVMPIARNLVEEEE